MTSLVAAIITAKPREKAGARTGARYAFQAHVSLAKMLDLHEEGIDYRAIFDYFDDLAIVQNSEAPSIIDLFQIKGKESGKWTAASLCAISRDAPRTTVGKMFVHTKIFGSAVKLATFLTNASFDFELADGGKSTPDHMNIHLRSLGSKDRARISQALDLDFPAPRSPDESTVIAFARTSVPVKGFEQMLKGRLVEFLEGKEAIVVSAAYRIYIEEISKRSNNTTDCSSIDDVYLHKSLSRADIQSVLDTASKHGGILDNWTVIDEELKAAHRTSVDRIKIKTEVISYISARSKRSCEIAALSSALKLGSTQAAYAVSQAADLLEAADAIRQAVPGGYLAVHAPLVVEAALLVEAFDALHE